jgi:hypothetical protein
MPSGYIDLCFFRPQIYGVIESCGRYVYGTIPPSSRYENASEPGNNHSPRFPPSLPEAQVGQLNFEPHRRDQSRIRRSHGFLSKPCCLRKISYNYTSADRQSMPAVLPVHIRSLRSRHAAPLSSVIWTLAFSMGSFFFSCAERSKGRRRWIRSVNGTEGVRSGFPTDDSGG